MLFEPIKIGKVECQNRIAMAPMAINVGFRSPEATLTQRAIDYFTERAKGGVGLIIMGATKVEKEIEGLSDVPLVSPLALPSFSELAESVHYYGTKLFVQLSAGLGRAIPGEVIDAGVQAVSASETPCFWRPDKSTRSLTVEEIEKLVAAFGRAAKILVAAGVDGVEVHGQGGYFLDQFMASVWNKRKDKYGGDLQGRLRIIIEIFQTIKKEAGEDFPVTCKFCLKHYLKGPDSGAIKGEVFEEAGRDVEEGLEIARILEKVGFDGLQVAAGCWESRYWINVPPYQPYGCMVDLAEQAKKVVSIPVITTGRISTPEFAEQILTKGQADIVALGRPLLADPYWPAKAKRASAETIRPCTSCNDGCRYRMAQGKPISCAVNPAAGKERLYEVRPAEVPKKVLVIGGGVAGMEVARIASARGHDVILCERSQNLGGHLIEVSVPGFKDGYKALLDWYRNQLSVAKVAVRMGTEVTTGLVREERPDVVIVATGSTPIIPDISGVEKPMVVTAVDLLLGRSKSGDTVVVVGGGLAGCEVALWLAQQGKKVIIVEILPEIFLDTLFANKLMLMKLLDLNEVEIMTGTCFNEIGDREVTVMSEGFGERKIACDTVVLAVGLKSERDLYNSLRQEIPEIYMIGDCKEPRKVMDAIWDAFNVGRTI